MPKIYEHVDPQPKLIDARKIGTTIQIDLQGVVMPIAPNQMPTYNLRSDLTTVRTFKILEYGATDPDTGKPYYAKLKVTDDILKVYFRRAEYNKILAVQQEINAMPPAEL